MKIEYQVSKGLSLLVGKDAFVQYSLHNRIYPESHVGSLLSLQELEESIKKQIDVLRVHTRENFNTMCRLETYIRCSFIQGDSYTGETEGIKRD
jgi:hypothetical protein